MGDFSSDFFSVSETKKRKGMMVSYGISCVYFLFSFAGLRELDVVLT